MHLEVTFRNLSPRTEVRRRAQALFRKLHRFLDDAAEGQLVVGVEHGNGIVELVVTTRGVTHKSTDEDEDLRTALDRAFHTVEDSLRRAKGRRASTRREAARNDLDELEAVFDRTAALEIDEELEAAEGPVL